MDNIKELSTKYYVHVVLVLIIIATYMYMNNVNKQNKKHYKKKYTELKQKIIQNKIQKEQQQKYMKELDSISDDSYMMSANVPEEAYEPQGIESDIASSHSDTINSHNGEPREISILENDYPQELSRKQQY